MIIRGLIRAYHIIKAIRELPDTLDNLERRLEDIERPQWKYVPTPSPYQPYTPPVEPYVPQQPWPWDGITWYDTSGGTVNVTTCKKCGLCGCDCHILPN